MSHHGREYEEDRVEYVGDSLADSLRKALRELGAVQICTPGVTRATCRIGSRKFVAIAETDEKALTALLRQVAASE